MSTPTTVDNWRCATCGTVYTDEQVAERCCICTQCGAETKRQSKCVDCVKANIDQRARERYEKLRQLPVVTYAGEPIFVEVIDRFFDDYDAMIDWLDDCPVDELPRLVDFIPQPCNKVKVSFSPLVEHVEEGWNEETGWEEPFEIPEKLKALLEVTEALLHAAAPTCWEPRYRERLTLVWEPETEDLSPEELADLQVALNGLKRPAVIEIADNLTPEAVLAFKEDWGAIEANERAADAVIAQATPIAEVDTVAEHEADDVETPAAAWISEELILTTRPERGCPLCQWQDDPVEQLVRRDIAHEAMRRRHENGFRQHRCSYCDHWYWPGPARAPQPGHA